MIDESGLMRGPLLRRTWAPEGQTPTITQRGAHRQKVSVAAAILLSPRRDHLGLYYHTLAGGYFDNWYVTAFVEAMLKERDGRFVVVWDGGTMPKGEPIAAMETHFADRLSLERLPPFAPMLNPVEWLWSWLKWERLSNLISGRRPIARPRPWSWLKWERLSNFAPLDVRERDARVIAELAAKRDDQSFLRNLFHASKLPLPRALFS